jgi:hypothetical protein
VLDCLSLCMSAHPLPSLPPPSGGFASRSGSHQRCWCLPVVSVFKHRFPRSSSWFLGELPFKLLLFLRPPSAPLCVVCCHGIRHSLPLWQILLGSEYVSTSKGNAIACSGAASARVLLVRAHLLVAQSVQLIRTWPGYGPARREIGLRKKAALAERIA